MTGGMSGPGFEVVTVLQTAAGSVIELSGELDVATVPILQDHLSDMIETGERCIVADLSGLTYTDSRGIGTLLAAHQRLRTLGGELFIHRPTPQVARIFGIAGITEILTERSPATLA
jgi:anti-sigma B factor antagonist